MSEIDSYGKEPHPSETDAAMRYHHAVVRAATFEEYCLVGQIWVGLGGMVSSFFLAQYVWWWWLLVGSIVLVFLGNVCPALTPVGVWVRRRERKREAVVLAALTHGRVGVNAAKPRSKNSVQVRPKNSLQVLWSLLVAGIVIVMLMLGWALPAFLARLLPSFFGPVPY